MLRQVDDEKWRSVTPWATPVVKTMPKSYVYSVAKGTLRVSLLTPQSCTWKIPGLTGPGIFNCQRTLEGPKVHGVRMACSSAFDGLDESRHKKAEKLPGRLVSVTCEVMTAQVIGNCTIRVWVPSQRVQIFPVYLVFALVMMFERENPVPPNHIRLGCTFQTEISGFKLWSFRHLVVMDGGEFEGLSSRWDQQNLRDDSLIQGKPFITCFTSHMKGHSRSWMICAPSTNNTINWIIS